jgi:hypothetical protein
MAEYSPARTWARKLLGPVPPRRPHTGPGVGTPEEIAASWLRFRRITTGESGAEEMWDERQELVADLPVRPGRDEHVPLVIDEYFGVCGAERCYFLGPDRDNEADALADAQEHCAAMAKKALRAAKKKKALRAAKARAELTAHLPQFTCPALFALVAFRDDHLATQPGRRSFTSKPAHRGTPRHDL